MLFIWLGPYERSRRANGTKSLPPSFLRLSLPPQTPNLGRNLETQEMLLEGKGRYQLFPCIEYVGSHPVVGTNDGSLYRFRGQPCSALLILPACLPS